MTKKEKQLKYLVSELVKIPTRFWTVKINKNHLTIDKTPTEIESYHKEYYLLNGLRMYKNYYGTIWIQALWYEFEEAFGSSENNEHYKELNEIIRKLNRKKNIEFYSKDKQKLEAFENIISFVKTVNK